MISQEVHDLAEVMAYIDGKIDRFNRCRIDEEFAYTDGTYMGYVAEATEMINRMKKRGWVISRAD